LCWVLKAGGKKAAYNVDTSFSYTSLYIAMARAAFGNKKEDGDFFHQEIGLKFKEQSREMVQLEHSFVWL
jgi:hypothetical protein